MNPISHKLIWKYQKHEQLLHSVLFRNSPGFVFQSRPSPLEGEIPVFVFHDAFPEEFEEKCLHLVRNGYRTISGDQFLHLLKSGKRPIDKTVVLTFDDGLKHVWTIAYPLLKKYGLQAICFLNPGCIPVDNHNIRPNLDDVWNGKTSPEETLSKGQGDSSLANWKEIRIMHESGVIDFQSHTMYHSLVFTSPEVFTFYNPTYQLSPYGTPNIHIPMYRRNGKDVVSRDPVLGLPIYRSKPRMSAERRYFDDEEIRNRCIEFVEKEGAEDFFEKKDWRRILRRLIQDCRSKGFVNEHYESPMERDQSLLEDMLNSKSMIEERLPGKKVAHLCYPWFEGSESAVEASKKAGYEANYYGCLWGKPTNHLGDDLYRITRIGGLFLHRLPGDGRRSLRETFRGKFSIRAAKWAS